MIVDTLVFPLYLCSEHNQKEWLWSSGRPVAPPRRHNVRQQGAADVDVVFRQTPPTVQFRNHDSLLSQNEHIYAEAEDDEDEC